MLNKDLYLNAMKAQGLADATDLQARSIEMDGTALYTENDKIPDFQAAKAAKNMMERKAGQDDGFVCRSTAGRVVRLIQNYNSETYPQEPEELDAQWRFVWSKNPEDALPFVSISTSPYNTGKYCLNNAGEPKRSTIDNNVWSPDTNPEYWEDPYQSDTEEHEGTLEDPIPWVYGMNCYAGKYYSYNGNTYKVAVGGDMIPCTWYPDSGIWQWELVTGGTEASVEDDVQY